METIDDNIKADFCLEIIYKKESENPSRVFHTMSQLIDNFQRIDMHLVKSIDVRIEPVLLLEDIETGSIRVWLSSMLKAIPDESLFNLNWKPIVGQYLVKAKYLMIDFVEQKTTISNVDEIKLLEENIYKLAEQTQVRRLASYTRPQTRELLEGIKDISSSLSYLSEGDSASYTTGEEEAKFNLQFKLAPESIEDLLAKETISEEGELILKVKKPDYLGESMWDFRFEDRIIQASVSDKEWLEKFQTRRIDVRPGDAIRGIMKIDRKYGHDGEWIGTHYDLVKVIEVIPMSNSEQLPLPEGDVDEK